MGGAVAPCESQANVLEGPGLIESLIDRLENGYIPLSLRPMGIAIRIDHHVEDVVGFVLLEQRVPFGASAVERISNRLCSTLSQCE